MPMNEPQPPDKFRRRIGRLAAGVLLIHITLCLVFACVRSGRLVKTLPGRLYRTLVLVGPFFEESVIRTSDRFYYRCKINDRWTAFTENSEARFQAYGQRIWRYNEFTRGDHIRRQGYELEQYLKAHGLNPAAAPASLKRINRYILHHAGTMPVDSVSIISVRDTYDPTLGASHADTVYRITYSPGSLDAH